MPPLIMRWCIAIHSRSPRAYDIVSNLLRLPHKKTLTRLIHKTPHRDGARIPLALIAC